MKHPDDHHREDLEDLLLRAVSSGDHAQIASVIEPLAAPPTTAEERPELNPREVQLLAASTLGTPHDPAPLATDTRLRVGHQIDTDGTIWPALAEHLAAGRTPKLPYPDHAVVQALHQQDPQGAARAMLHAPARRLARHPELVQRLPDAWTPWPRLAQALDPLGAGLWRAASGDSLTERAARLIDEDAAALVGWLDPAHRPLEFGHQLALEVASLEHAALIAARSGQAVEADRVWELGLLLRRVVMESPFFGADAELFAARLRAALPPDRRHAIGSPGALAGAVDLGVHLALGVLARQPAAHPLPKQLEQLLLDLANQTATPTAWAEERHTWATGFTDPARHVAPTLAARHVLHLRGAPVWVHMGPAARVETMETLAALHPLDEPRVRWILFALDRGARMGETAEAPLAPLVEGRLADLEGDAAAALALAGMTVVEELPERWHEARSWEAAAEQAGDRWRVGLLRTLAERSARLRESAIGALLGLVQQPRFSVAAATALLGLARGGLWPVDALTQGWTSFPEHVRREPALARDFLRETRRGAR